MPKDIKPIETMAEFEYAQERLKALDTGMPGSPDEDELMALQMAVDKWKRDHAEMPKTIRPIIGRSHDA